VHCIDLDGDALEIARGRCRSAGHDHVAFEKVAVATHAPVQLYDAVLVREMLDREIDHTRLGVGIAGMRERLRKLGGQLEIRSSSKGTTVIAVLPREPEGQPTLVEQTAASN